jgi:hypothetical protein
MQESFNKDERVVIFPVSKLPKEGLWDVELSTTENGNWSRYYLGRFYFKKELNIANRFVKKRMIRLG